jgi:calcium-dependent protein kinase
LNLNLDWEKISPYAKDLLQNMLCDVKSRFSAQQVLDHEWLKKIRIDEKREAHLLDLNYKSIIEFSKMNQFKKSVLRFIASRVNNNEIKNLREIFVAMDSNGDGFLTYEELQSAFGKMNVNDVDLKELFDGMDNNKNGFINYTEFLAATIDEVSFLTEEKLLEAFRIYDEDKSGKISIDELNKVLHTNEIDLNAIKDSIKEINTNGDGEIDYVEFCKLMGKVVKEKKRRSKLQLFMESI